ncbi:MAG TPA: patatin-like phospholipase family protein [Nitrospirota bacterium]
MTNGEKNTRTVFDEVLEAELEEIERSRRARGVSPGDGSEQTTGSDSPAQKAVAMNLVGLAFSGGGIRSATFNLGILQGLARRGLLKSIDYLSTVSGGGYIGSWLMAWIKRVGSIKKVEEELLRPTGSGAAYREPDPIAFLRKYSNYLTPKMGLLSADTWALIAVYLRNLTLNLLIITAFFQAVFLVPRLATLYADTLIGMNGATSGLLFRSAMLYLVLGVFFISLNQSYWTIKKQAGAPGKVYPWFAQQWGVITFVALPSVLSAMMGSLQLWQYSIQRAQLNAWHFYTMVLYVLIAWTTGFLAARMYAKATLKQDATRTEDVTCSTSGPAGNAQNQRKERPRVASRPKFITVGVSLIVALCAGGGLFMALVPLFRHWKAGDPSSLWYAVNFGPPLVLVIFMLMGTILIGIMGRHMPDESREWWSRLGGWLIICAGCWTILCAIAFFSLPVIASAKALISSGWVASTIAGVFLGKSPATGGEKSKTWMKVAATLLPSLFVIGLLMFLSFLNSSILIWSKGWDTLWPLLWVQDRSFDELTAVNFLLMNDTLDMRLAAMFAASLGAALYLSWRIDINQFSIHLLYRNRLVRGYLGASNKTRQGQPFTGFDPNDDVPVSDLQTGTSYAGPYPIINFALNLVKGRDLAWQTRKASSFMFTPMYSGYVSTTSRNPDKLEYRYQPTVDYGKPDGMSLGTAMAISGAAASPNMGYHSSPAMAFLLTVFNVRLGWWSGNTLYPDAWAKAGPGIALWYLLKELFGLTNDETKFVYLSDGGHFENLGVYELVKRRCRFIIACDSGQDNGPKFDDLGNALRKIRVDLGVDITIDVSPIRDGKKHCALGTIHYRSSNGKNEYGHLIYIKASLCGQEPADVRNYKAQHDEFPHQTTADQWFDEAQFESYRMLGLHTLLEISERWDGRDLETLVKQAEQ